MKSTAETSSGCAIQMSQLSPVVTGTGLELLHLADVGDQAIAVICCATSALVADHDGLDVAVLAGELDGRADFALVTVDSRLNGFALAVCRSRRRP